MFTVMTLALFLIVLYYWSGMEQTVLLLLTKVKNIAKYGFKIGNKIIYRNESFRPFTNCITCTTFWVLLLLIIANYIVYNNISTNYLFILIGYTIIADSIRRLIFVLKSNIDNFIDKFEK